MRLIDVHTHTQFAAYDEDHEAVIKRAQYNGVGIINVGTQKDTSLAAIDFAHKFGENVWATVGLHPIHTEASFHDTEELGGDVSSKEFTSRGEEFDYEEYKKIASDKKVVAIGECGLDYYRLEENTKDKQTKVFEGQIKLANDVEKPLMIHCREAFPDLIDTLKSNKSNLKDNSPGVIHFFSGSQEEADKLMDLGFSFSFGGVVTFARVYEKLVRHIPLDRILLETDAPYVTPVPHRGKRNEPSYVKFVAEKISRIKNVSFEEVAETTTKTAIRIFNLE
jgi:TatD DNase family protein